MSNDDDKYANVDGVSWDIAKRMELAIQEGMRAAALMGRPLDSHLAKAAQHRIREIPAWLAGQPGIVLMRVAAADNSAVMRATSKALSSPRALHGAEPRNPDQIGALLSAVLRRWRPFQSAQLADAPGPELWAKMIASDDQLRHDPMIHGHEINRGHLVESAATLHLMTGTVPPWLTWLNEWAVEKEPDITRVMLNEIRGLDEESSDRLGSLLDLIEMPVLPGADGWSPPLALPIWAEHCGAHRALLSLALAIWNVEVGEAWAKMNRPSAVSLDFYDRFERAHYGLTVDRNLMEGVIDASRSPAFILLFLRLIEQLHTNAADPENHHQDRVQLPSLTVLKKEFGTRTTSDIKTALDWGSQFQWDPGNGPVSSLWSVQYRRPGRGKSGAVIMTCSAAFTDAVVHPGFSDGKRGCLVPVPSWTHERPTALNRAHSGREWVLWLLIWPALRKKWRDLNTGDGYLLDTTWWRDRVTEAGIDPKHTAQLQKVYSEHVFDRTEAGRWRLVDRLKAEREVYEVGAQRSLNATRKGKASAKKRSFKRDKTDKPG
jgi:hypothetical protein